MNRALPLWDWQQKYEKGDACNLQIHVHSLVWSTEHSLFSVESEQWN
jgi:hypothetical protein